MQRATFTLLRPIHWIALVVMVISAGYALTGFMHPAMAFTVAAVLTFLLKALVETTAEAVHTRRPVMCSAALVGTVLIASITVALTAATLYAKVFATPSAIQDWTIRREPVERELQRTLSLANTAHAAMAAWAGDAALKAEQEARDAGGGSCPNRPDTKGARGPVYYFRDNDAKIAVALAADLKGLLDTAQASTATLLAQAKPTEFAAVNAGFNAANKAADDISRLTGGGSYASATAKLLGAQRMMAIELAGGQSVTCGDQARLTHIERASEALNALAAVKAMPRMAPGVDVSNAHEVLSRSMLRSFNGVLAMVTLGRAGNFADDALMTGAMKNGMLNRETLAFVISIMAEVAVILTALLLVRLGRAPYVDNAVSWIDDVQARHPSPGAARAALLGIARRLANVFYVQASATPAGDQAMEVLDAVPTGTGTGNGFGEIALFDDPACRAREAQWAQPLLPYHFASGSKDFAIIPIAPDTRQVRSMAHALRAQGQFHCLSAAAPAKVFSDKPEVVAQMLASYGDAWRQLQFEVFSIGESFSQLLRLQSIGPGLAAVPAGSAASPDSPWSKRTRHVPFSQKLAARPSSKA